MDSDRLKIVELLLAAIINEMKRENKESMIRFLVRWSEQNSGSCGDGSFDYKQRAKEQTLRDNAVYAIKFPHTLVQP